MTNDINGKRENFKMTFHCNLCPNYILFVLQGNYSKFLKNLHAEQIAKLQLKNQNECELLDDMR